MSNSPDIPIPTAEGSSQPRGFRWRLIPTLLLMPSGGLLAVGWIVYWIIGWSDTFGPAARVQSLRAVPLLMILAGFLWVVSGLCFWKRRWWLAVICLLLGYGFGCWGMWLYEKHEPKEALHRTPGVAPSCLQFDIGPAAVSRLAATQPMQHTLIISGFICGMFLSGCASIKNVSTTNPIDHGVAYPFDEDAIAMAETHLPKLLEGSWEGYGTTDGTNHYYGFIFSRSNDGAVKGVGYTWDKYTPVWRTGIVNAVTFQNGKISWFLHYPVIAPHFEGTLSGGTLHLSEWFVHPWGEMQLHRVKELRAISAEPGR